MYNSVLVYLPYASPLVFLIIEGISLTRRVRNPPVWTEELSRVDIFQDDVVFFVGDGWCISLL